MRLKGKLMYKADRSIRFILILALTLFISIFITASLNIANKVFAASAPTITAIAPSSGSNAGGDIVTITGSNFVNTDKVYFDNALATIQAVASDGTTLTVTTSIHDAGLVDATVVDASNNRATLSNAFTYVEVSPVVTGISPLKGTIAGNKTVTINGSNFIKKYNFTSLATGSTASHECGIASSKVYCWGYNNYGQLGDGTTVSRSVPTAVLTTGTPMNGKTIVDIAVGQYHTVALASDGTVYTWGYNAQGELGNNTTATSYAPIAVTSTGVLNGKTITQVAAGYYHTIALASDGTVYSWGYNNYGQLGNNSTTQSNIPVAVTTSGVLSGKIITQVAVGLYNSVALASDGTVYSWGYNGNGELGNSTATTSYVPVAVTATGVLSSKVITNIATGSEHVVALASDGTVYTWGYNSQGQLGNNTTATSSSPVAVIATGVLSGKTITQVAAGYYHTIALSSDGTVYTWGYNGHGELGNSTTTNNSAPVVVTSTGAISGRSITGIYATQYSTNTLASNGSIYSWGYNGYGQLGDNTTTTRTTAVQAIGLDGNNKDGSLFTIPTVFLDNLSLTNIIYVSSTQLTGVTPAHIAGTVDLKVTNYDNQSATLTNAYTYLAAPTITSITPSTGSNAGGDTVTITGTNFNSDAKVTFNGITATVTNVSPDGTTITVTTPSVTTVGDAEVRVTNDDGQYARTYFTYTGAAPTITSITPNRGPIAGGQTVTVNGSGFYQNLQFSKISQGSQSGHSCGISTGKVYCWGYNNYGQLGDGTTVNRSVPTAVLTTGTTMDSKSIIDIATGDYHTIALASDGTVYTWGYNNYGQLGNNTTTNSSVPVAVTSTGVLSGKTITQVAAGTSDSVAVASDGTVYTWGYNGYGQLGNNTTTNSSVPIAVTSTGVLSGKTITQVAEGYYYTAALASDGTVYTWGYNNYGQLGNDTTATSTIPVEITNTGILLGKTIINLSAGYGNVVALASDGTVYTWGYNNYGQLGNSTTVQSNIPVAVTTTGVLNGKTITQVSAGTSDSIAVASDGTVYAWGYNGYGQLGNNTTTNSSVPVAVTTTGVLNGKTITQVAEENNYTIAIDNDGSAYSWGQNTYGQLGNNNTTNSISPTVVSIGEPIPFTIELGGNSIQALNQTSGQFQFITPAHNFGYVDMVMSSSLYSQTIVLNAYRYVLHQLLVAFSQIMDHLLEVIRLA